MVSLQNTKKNTLEVICRYCKLLSYLPKITLLLRIFSEGEKGESNQIRKFDRDSLQL